MSNMLWRFGDSWSVTQDNLYGNIEKNHSKYIADHFKMDWIQKGNEGTSNFEILIDIIENIHHYKENDIILISWSYKNRYTAVEDGKLLCTNGAAETYEKIKDIPLLKNILMNDMIKPINDIIFYIFNSLSLSLLEKNINIYHFFIDKSGDEYTLPNKLLFESAGNLGGFEDWCEENGYRDLSPKGNEHYTLGSQKQIANHLIERINNNV